MCSAFKPAQAGRITPEAYRSARRAYRASMRGDWALTDPSLTPRWVQETCVLPQERDPLARPLVDRVWNAGGSLAYRNLIARGRGD